MANDIKENIKRLLDSELTAYQIQKETGINRSTITRLRNGETPIGKMQLDNAIALIEFWDNHNNLDK